MNKTNQSNGKACIKGKCICCSPVPNYLNPDAWREGVLVFRSWVALRLGVSKDQLLQRLQRDPLIHPYVRVEQI